MKQRAVVILIVVLCGPLLMWNTQLRLSVIQYRTSSDACLDKLNRLSAENTRLAGKVRCIGAYAPAAKMHGQMGAYQKVPGPDQRVEWADRQLRLVGCGGSGSVNL